MFNLERSISNWRRQMIAGGIKSSAVLDELESHLREDVERRVRSGTPAEKAFEEAVQKVGRADELQLEFGKIQPQRPAVSPRLISRACIAMGVFLVLTGMWALIDAPIVERLLGFAWLMLVGAYLAVLPRLNRKVRPGVSGLAFRKAVATTCSFSLLVWIALALLSCAHINIIHFFSSDVVPNLILWPMMYAAIATTWVIAFTTDEHALGVWSPTAEQCLVLAQQEAREFHHDFVGTEHILLGLLESEEGPVAKVLGQMGVRRDAVRAEIEKFFALPQPQPRRAPVYTPRANKAMQLALQEATSLRRDRVEEPDLLLGLLREGGGVAALVLTRLGVDLNQARLEILKKTT